MSNLNWLDYAQLKIIHLDYLHNQMSTNFISQTLWQTTWDCLEAVLHTIH